MSKDDIVEITQVRKDNLLESEKFLNALLAAGVKDWQGYEVAQEIYNDLNG